MENDTLPDVEKLTLALTGITKSYGARRVLRDFALTAAGGEVVAVVGANGSGKSTLLKIVAGLLRPTRGTISLTIDGTDQSDPALRRRAVGYLSPDLTLYPELTGQENLAFFAAARGEALSPEAITAALEAVGLGGRSDDPMSVYSSGMRQRLKLALATLFTPTLLLLDEPGLALDTNGVALVAERVRGARERGALVLLATNDLQEAAWADRAIALTE